MIDLALLPGLTVSEKYRDIKGIKQRKHGDIIFVLSQGYAFSPNYFGYSKMKGYHGYLKYDSSHQGILATTKNINIDNRLGTKDLFKLLFRDGVINV